MLSEKGYRALGSCGVEDYKKKSGNQVVYPKK
jgi:hypothetical protein